MQACVYVLLVGATDIMEGRSAFCSWSRSKSTKPEGDMQPVIPALINYDLIIS